MEQQQTGLNALSRRWMFHFPHGLRVRGHGAATDRPEVRHSQMTNLSSLKERDGDRSRHPDDILDRTYAWLASVAAKRPFGTTSGVCGGGRSKPTLRKAAGTPAGEADLALVMPNQDQ